MTTSEPRDPSQRPDPSTEVQAEPPRKKMRFLCDRCGFEMIDDKCKVICPNCGARLDCSDLNIYFD